MKAHNPELVGALLDGELKGLRRWLVQRHVDRCPLCAAEYRHLHHVRQMLAANPLPVEMSDSPEFFWSKVKRQIQIRDAAATPVVMPHLSVTDWLGQHRLALASAATVLVGIVGLVFALQSHTTPVKVAALPAPIIELPATSVQHASTFIHDVVATTIEAKDSDSTVIWVSGLPWTSDMTEMKTRFAQMDI